VWGSTLGQPPAYGVAAAIEKATALAATRAVAPNTVVLGNGLTVRERDVLRLLVEGHSNPEIAATLFISHKTVRNHVTNILAKLGVESRTAAATFALRQGLV
jgi:DNA-binding NarL/FixJ family response regulator